MPTAGEYSVIPDLTPSATDLSTVPVGTPEQAVGPILTECQQILSSIEQALTDDIQACLNECHGSLGVCHACVLGNLERDLGGAGITLDKCDGKIIQDAGATMRELWLVAMGAGIPPPTDDQLAAALAGQPIPEPPADAAPAADVLATPSGVTDAAAALVADINELAKPRIDTTPAPFLADILPDGQEVWVFTQPVYDAQGNLARVDTRTQIFEPGTQVTGGPTPTADGATSPTPTVTPIYQGPITPLTGVPTTSPIGSQPGSGTTNGSVTAEYWVICNVNGSRFVLTSYAPGYTFQQLRQVTTGSDQWFTGFGPYPTYDAAAAALPTVDCGTGPPPPTNGGTPPPPPPPAPTCPTCGAGYHFATDANGNPVCVPDCSCPACPTLPGGGGGPQPPTPEEAKPAVNGIEFCDPTGWQSVGGTIDQLGGSWDSAGFVDALQGAFSFDPAASWTDILKQIVGFPIRLQGAIVSGVVDLVDNLLNLIPVGSIPGGASGSCQSPAYHGYSLTNALVGFMAHFGLAPPAMVASYRNTLNYLCQWQIPSTPELNAAWARNWVNSDEWEYGVKLNGSCVPWQKRVRELSRLRIGITDAYRLFKLGKLSDEEFLNSWREQGIDIDRDLGRWSETVLVYPPTADLIRMMVRDVEDESVVADYQLDAEFGDKWTGTLRQWGQAQGLTDDVARRYWRAHWQAPAPTQIFEWVHRLRPIDRDPADPNADVVFTRADAEKALRIADYVPGLIDAYLATSYKPLTRVDVRRMWRVGTFTSKDQLRRAYLDLGYDANRAQQLADFTERSEASARAKFTGATSDLDVTKALIAGLLDEGEARQLYTEAGLTDEQQTARIRAANIRADISDRKRILDSLRKRFFMGEFNLPQLQGELSAAGLPGDRAAQLSRVWNAEREARQKHPTIDMLCKWWSRNLITLDDFFQRVRNLNYKEADALLVVQNCQVGLQELRQKELERETARIEQKKKQAAREAAAAIRAARPYTVVKPRVSLGPQARHTVQRRGTNGKFTTTVTDTLTSEQTEPPTPPPIVP